MTVRTVIARKAVGRALTHRAAKAVRCTRGPLANAVMANVGGHRAMARPNPSMDIAVTATALAVTDPMAAARPAIVPAPPSVTAAPAATSSARIVRRVPLAPPSRGNRAMKVARRLAAMIVARTHHAPRRPVVPKRAALMARARSTAGALVNGPAAAIARVVQKAHTSGPSRIRPEPKTEIRGDAAMRPLSYRSLHNSRQIHHAG